MLQGLVNYVAGACMGYIPHASTSYVVQTVRVLTPIAPPIPTVERLLQDAPRNCKSCICHGSPAVQSMYAAVIDRWNAIRTYTHTELAENCHSLAVHVNVACSNTAWHAITSLLLSVYRHCMHGWSDIKTPNSVGLTMDAASKLCSPSIFTQTCKENLLEK